MKVVVNSGATSGNFLTAVGASALNSNTIGSHNTAVGNTALAANTTGAQNTAVGGISLTTLSTGAHDTAVGFDALRFTTTASDDTAVGHSAMRSNTTGAQNTATGYQGLYYNTTGASNSAFGYNAGIGDNTTQDQRSVIDTFATFLGYQSSRSESVASTTVLTNLTAIGKNARVGCSNCLVLGGTGVDAVNVGIGTTTPQWGLQIATSTGPNTKPQFTLSDIGAGTDLKHWTMRSVGGNLYIATSSDVFATSTTAAMTLTNNGWLGIGTTSPSASLSTAGQLFIGGTGTSTFTGSLALPTTVDSLSGVIFKGGSRFMHNFAIPGTTGNNTFLGIDAGNFTMTGSTGAQGSNLVGIGKDALKANTTGQDNTAVGSGALDVNTTGSNNSAFGVNALGANTSGVYNSAFGLSALGALVGGSDGNVGIGMWTLLSHASVANNTVVGAFAGGGAAGSLSNNSLFGYAAGNLLTTGSNNILLGLQAGDAMTTGSNNVVIGYNIDAPSNTASNQLNIGNIIFGKGINGANTTLSNGTIGIGTTTPAWLLQLASSTEPQLTLTDTGAGTDLKHWTMRSVGGNLYIATSSDVYATSTIAALTVTPNGWLGIGTTSPSQSLSTAGAIFSGDSSATSTFMGGLSVAGAAGLTVLQNGNTGIGTTSPTFSLSVSSSGGGIALDRTGGAESFIRLSLNGAGGGQVRGLSGGGIRFTDFGANIEWARITSTRFFGLGTTTPQYLLSPFSATAPQLSLSAGAGISQWTARNAGGNLYFSTTTLAGTATSTIAALTLDANGYLGIGTTTPWRTLSVAGTAAINGLTGSNTGNYLCINTTTFEITNSGTACSLSSIRFKTDIEDYTLGLDSLMKLRPVTFHFKPGIGQDTTKLQEGFIAEEVLEVDPTLVSYDTDGKVGGLDYPKFVVMLTKAVQELAQKVSAGGSAIAGAVGDAVAYFKKLVADEVETKKLTAEKLCVGDTCVTEGELKILLNKNSVTSAPATVPVPPPPAPAPEPEPSPTPTDISTSTPLEIKEIEKPPEKIEPEVTPAPAPENPPVGAATSTAP